MPTTASALGSLLPLAGAVALTIQGLRRILSRRTGDSLPPAPPLQPIEVPDPTRRASSPKKAVPDGTCTACGTSVPGGQTVCAACDRRAAGAANSAANTAVHWLVFLAVMSAIIGAGALLSP
jgi:hypothetical protein